MKKQLLTIVICLAAVLSFAGNQLTEGFEYGNHDGETPVGWISANDSWLCGYLEKDHNRKPHTGNWYVHTNSAESWMFMEMNIIQQMQYRFSLWAISDGGYQLEIWAGHAANSSAMTQLLFDGIVSSGSYEKFSAYIAEMLSDYEYFGIHAVSAYGGDYILTIDDVDIDVVRQYDFEAEEISGDTVMYPGTEAVFHYLVHNTGYDPLDITLHPSNEFFTDISNYANGVAGATFHAEPDETVRVVTCATLRPEIQPGTVAWLDVMMTIPCGCNTAMVTFWVTPLDVTKVPENPVEISIFPNPATDFVTVKAEALQYVDVIDETGRTIKRVPANGNALQLDLSDLKAGTYFISAKTRSTSAFVKPILKM